MRAAKGEAVILVRIETSPEDIHGMHAARGILTTRGGMTSHAAVVARGMGKCLRFRRWRYPHQLRRAHEFSAGSKTVREGETLTINGSTGEVMLGEVGTVEPNDVGRFFNGHVLGGCRAFRRLRIRANAETPLDAKTALRFRC